MKKRIISGLFALALLSSTGYGVTRSMNNDAGLSTLALSNVEALAQSESGNRPYQSQGYCTMWRLGNMCSSSGTYACTDDC